MTKLLGKSHESGEVRLSGREQTRLPKELVLSGDEQTGRSSYWERTATYMAYIPVAPIESSRLFEPIIG